MYLFSGSVDTKVEKLMLDWGNYLNQAKKGSFSSDMFDELGA